MDEITYITTINESGSIKDLPLCLELKGQEVEIIIKPHTQSNKAKAVLRHQDLRKRIQAKSKPLSVYNCEERDEIIGEQYRTWKNEFV